MIQRIYQVRVIVERQVRVEFLNWLRVHMNEMLLLSHFTQTELLELKDQSGECVTFVAKYFYEKPEDIQNYFEKDAEKMRSHLPEGFKKLIRFQRSLVEENIL